MKETLGKDFLIKEIAARANFTQSDIKIVWKVLEEIIEEAVQNAPEDLAEMPLPDNPKKGREAKVIFVGGLFEISVREILPHEGYDAFRKKKTFFPLAYRVNMKPSTSLTNLLRK